MTGPKILALIKWAQILEAKWMLGEETPSTTDEYMNAPADDEEIEEKKQKEEK